MVKWKLACGPAAVLLSLLALSCASLPRTGRPAEPEAEPEATAAGEALAWRRLAWVDERGDIAAGALEKALRQRRANVAFWRTRGLSRVAGIARGEWVNRGPQNIGGRTRALLIDPTNPQHMWAASVGGGLWKSVNGGRTWAAVDDFLPRLSVSSLAMDPGNSSILYAGTGEGFFNGDALDGAGILKSVDGGATWTQLSATRTWVAVNRIAVSPEDSRTLLAAVIYRFSTNFFEPEGGILRSLDGGETWTEVKKARGGFFVAFDPNQPGRAVASALDIDHSHKAFYSEDSGATWQAVIGLPELATRIELAYAPSTVGMVYAHLGGIIWRSADGGRSFVQMTRTGNTGGNWYMAALWVSPVDARILVAGGVHLFRSTDSGRTLEQISNSYGPPGQPHADQHCIVSAPGFDGIENRRAYVCNDGGIFRTEDIYNTSPIRSWVSLNTGYQTTQFYGAAGSGPLIVGGTQDNGTIVLTQGSEQGKEMYGGDGGFSAIDHQDPRFCYGEYIGLQIFRSWDSGQTTQRIDTTLLDALNGAANFIAPFILDPNEPQRMLAGGESLWRTEDVRYGTPPKWDRIPLPDTASHNRTSAIAVAPGHSNILWVARNNGVIWKTTQGLSSQPEWKAVDDNAGNNPLPNRFPTRILIDRENSDRVYIAFGGFTDGNLMRTLDGGATWTDATGSGPMGLPEAPIRGIAQHPVHADWIYAGTEVGVFASEDGGQHWSAVNQGPANVSVDELVFMHDSSVLLAATHGRGIWTVDTGAAPPPGCTPDAHTLCLGDGRFSVRANWKDGRGGSGAASAEPITSDTGYFWFFDAANVELLVKALDGCTLNDHFWIFAGGLTNVEVEILVVDTETGESRTYTNPQGKAFLPIQDTSAFSTCSAGAATAAVASSADATGGCPSGNTGLCLKQERFKIEVDWTTADNRTGQGTGVRLTGDTGYFWFFDPANVEMIVKVLDGCGLNHKFWIFAAGLTDVGVDIRITDTTTGAVKTYRNFRGTSFAPIQDTAAFGTCP